jgi:hypothetical protein
MCAKDSRLAVLEHNSDYRPTTQEDVHWTEAGFFKRWLLNRDGTSDEKLELIRQ